MTDTPEHSRTLHRALVGTLIFSTILSIAGGIAGALLVAYLRPQPAPTRIAVVDITRLTHAAKSSGQDPWTTGFTDRLNQAIATLQQGDPDRVLLIKEAVVGNSAEDLTDTLLPIAFASSQPTSRVTPPVGASSGK
jgi:hypothetical protein